MLKILANPKQVTHIAQRMGLVAMTTALEEYKLQWEVVRRAREAFAASYKAFMRITDTATFGTEYVAAGGNFVV